MLGYNLNQHEELLEQPDWSPHLLCVNAITGPTEPVLGRAHRLSRDTGNQLGRGVALRGSPAKIVRERPVCWVAARDPGAGGLWGPTVPGWG